MQQLPLLPTSMFRLTLTSSQPHHLSAASAVRPAASRGRLPAGGEDSGMAHVLTWLFADGSSSIAGQDAAAIPQDMSVSSLQVNAGHLRTLPVLHAHCWMAWVPAVCQTAGQSRVSFGSVPSPVYKVRTAPLMTIIVVSAGRA